MERVALDREWWADAQGNPVPFGSLAGVSVLYGMGALVPASVADSLKALTEAPADKAIKSPPADKAIRSPRATK